MEKPIQELLAFLQPQSLMQSLLASQPMQEEIQRKEKNSLLAAATAVNNLYGIARHSQGPTRINVGQLNAGTGRNVIPDRARLVIETRGGYL